MKLCRFELLNSPSTPRSGIIHDGHVYETDGKKPVGVHCLSKIRLLRPVGFPPSLRLYEAGEPLSFNYLNSSNLFGTLEQLSAPSMTKELDFDIRVAAVIREQGEFIEQHEAKDFILGYTLYFGFVGLDLLSSSEYERGSFPVNAYDFPGAFGAYITTPEDTEPYTNYALEYCKFRCKTSISINEVEIYSNEEDIKHGFAKLLEHASKSQSLCSGDLICAPPLQKPTLKNTLLGRGLYPGDKIKIVVEPLGALFVTVV